MPLNHMGVFRGWVKQQIPTIYDDTLTYYELITKVIGYLNQLLDGYNEIVEFVNEEEIKRIKSIKELKDSFEKYKEEIDLDVSKLHSEFNTLKLWIESEGLPQYLTDTMNDWLENGTLADVINNDVFNMKANESDLKIVEQDIININEKIEKNTIVISSEEPENAEIWYEEI